jgi:hypothetical protein
MNKWAINVFTIEKKEILPLLLSKTDFSPRINLLMFSKDLIDGAAKILTKIIRILRAGMMMMMMMMMMRNKRLYSISHI